MVTSNKPNPYRVTAGRAAHRRVAVAAAGRPARHGGLVVKR